jgi:pimeloyl-ACP methyl ester carboxylesterase
VRVALAAAVVAACEVAQAGSAAIGTVKNIVLVHGANTDGSGWRGVYDILTKDGFLFLDPNRFAADTAADLPPAQARYMADSQMPVAAAAFDAPVTVAAWRNKPSYGIVATADHALNPKLARWMYKRSGATMTEIQGSHMVYMSQPRAVASVIENAARSVK